MDLILADWGTSRFRGFRVADGAIIERVVSDEEGISELAAGQHAAVFRRRCGPWLDAWPDAPVLLVGMVGSREGWREAPYVPCPAGPDEIAARLVPVELGGGRRAHIVPGLVCEPAPGALDVCRGEETLGLGSGVADGLVVMPGTHSKWMSLEAGRVTGFASAMTGEMYALLREHSMIGRPATEPADEAGFAQGLEAAERNQAERRPGLLHLLFGARAAVVGGRLPAAQLAPYLSGLLTGDEVAGMLSCLGRPERVTIVQHAARARHYEAALGRLGISTAVLDPEPALVAGVARIAAALGRP